MMRTASMGRRGTYRRVYGPVTLLVLLGAVAVLASGVLSDDGAEAMSAVMQAVGAGLALGACVAAAERADGRWRRTWQLLSITSGLWFVGNVVAIVLGVFVEDVPFPSLADVFWLPALPVAFAGLVTVPGRLDWRGRSRVSVDSLLLGFSMLYVTWALLLGRAYEDTAFGPLAKSVMVLYWVFDTQVFALAIILLLRSQAGRRRPLVLASLGFIAYTLTDALFLDRSLSGSFQLGSPFDVGWLLGLVLIASAALAFAPADAVVVPARAKRASDRRIMFGSMLTSVPFLAVFLVSVGPGKDLDGSARAIEAVLLVATAAIFVYAQFTTLRENLRLTGNLEDTVADRTRELAGAVELQDLTLRAVNDGILGLGHDGRLVFANEAACTMVHLPREQVLGRFVFEVVTVGPEDHSLLMSIQDVIGQGQRFVIDDVEVQRSDGSRLSIELAVTPVSRDHPLLTSVAVFRDVTHRHEVDRMKDEFVSVVSHELRTPLTSIRGSLGLLAGGVLGELPKEGRRMLEIAVDNTDRLIRLINDILDIERIQSGSVVFQKRQCEAAELIAESLRIVVPLARAAGVDVGLAKVEGAVLGDADRLVQTLTNLVSNAVKFSPPGGAITLSAERVGGDVLFRVTDEGRGIPTDRLETIFDRFAQVDASDSRQKGGTGLGLAICRSIVEQHGGRIWAESGTGTGSTFSFTVPAAPVSEPTYVEPTGDGPLVLVCDDDPSLLEVASMLLSTHGYRVIVARDGAEAVKLAVAERPAVIVLDMFMPELDGWHTIKELKARPESSGIPVLVLSVLDADQADGLGDLVDTWLTKPSGATDSLVAAVEQLLGAESHVPRVLIVEDDEDLARVLATSLERRGLRVGIATTAAQGTRLSRTFLPDLLVLDVVLPDGDGFAVVDQLRRDGRLSSIPVVIYTARDLSEADRSRLTLGETEILFKSRVSPETFERRVLALLDGVLGGAS